VNTAIRGDQEPNIPNDVQSVINEDDPAAGLLANKALVVVRQLEMLSA
jgi:hypothetical protein